MKILFCASARYTKWRMCFPQREEAKKYISDRVEEIEREEIFVKKLIRQRVEGMGS
jgi:vacuolar-type H+-ATPase subunit D/Vma8